MTTIWDGSFLKINKIEHEKNNSSNIGFSLILPVELCAKLCSRTILHDARCVPSKRRSILRHVNFISLGKSYDDGTLWRIPLSVELGITSTPIDTDKISVSDIPELRDINYVHFGDPDCYQYDGINYILVPTYSGTEGGSNNGAIACFRARDLKYMNYAVVTGEKPGFCFVDKEGNIYVKENQTSLRRYTTNWDR